MNNDGKVPEWIESILESYNIGSEYDMYVELLQEARWRFTMFNVPINYKHIGIMDNGIVWNIIKNPNRGNIIELGIYEWITGENTGLFELSIFKFNSYKKALAYLKENYKTVERKMPDKD